MSQHINTILNEMKGLSTGDKALLKKAMDALIDNVAELIVDVTAVATALDTLATKLNADGGVTDTNYATGNAAAITASAGLTN